MDPPNARVNLLMAGGGVRLAAFVGALATFRHMGVEVAAVAGASAGSIVGSFLARGWSVEQMLSRLLETDFTQFKDISLSRAPWARAPRCSCSTNRWARSTRSCATT